LQHRFFQLQKSLAWRIDRFSEELEYPAPATYWPSFDKSTVLHDCYIVPEHGGNFFTPKKKDIVTGTYFVMKCHIDQFRIDVSSNTRIAREYQDRQLVTVSKDWEQRITQYFLVSTRAQFVPEESLTGDDKRSRLTKISKL
jgi:hypothetical protein